ncbi:MAG: PcfJ domain-containing protein [Labilithrix sp.]|nr:PcfJ domain-containing protein [Labilithrix sp.]
MSKKNKEEGSSRARYAALQKARKEAQAREAEARALREAAIANALRRSPARASTRLPGAIESVIARKAPRLIDPRYGRALERLFALPGLRSLETWKPRGKSAETLFRSLAEHRLAKFPTPAIVWNAFHDDAADKLVGLAAHVAGGGSLYEFVKTRFEVPLTRKMCHDLLATPAEYKLLDAVRRAQIRAAGGSARLFETWRGTHHGRHVGTENEEVFWASVIAWFAAAAMLDPREVPTLCDYIAHRRREDASFSMKGRSALAMLRGMREWHQALTNEKVVSSKLFPMSGLSSGTFEDFRRESGETVKQIWRIREVLTAKALAEEGRRMGHCVYSYAWRIERGDTSIWSVQMEDGRGETGNWHMVTLEVRNDLKRLVQARGRFNRAMTPHETRIVTRWAAENRLAFALGAW